MTGLVLTLDAGTTGGRVCAFDAAGTLKASARTPWIYTYLGELVPRVDFDAVAWCRAFEGLLHQVLSSIDPHAVRAIAVTGQRQGCVATAADGAVLYAGPNLDVRGLEVAFDLEEALDAFDPARLARLGRWPAWLSGAGRVFWLKHTQPEAFARLAHVETVPAYLASWLTGGAARAESPSTAADTCLLDVITHSWDAEVLTRLGLDSSQLPSVLPTCEPVGPIALALAQELNLPGEVPVVVAGGDTACAALGANLLDGAADLAALGSTTPVVRFTDTSHLDPERLLWTTPHVAPGQWQLEASCGETGRLVDWFHTELARETPIADLFSEAAAVDPGSDGVRGCLGPRLQRLGDLSLSANRGAWSLPIRTPQGQRPTRAALFRGLLENITYAVRQCTTELDRCLPVEGVRPIRAVGGLTASPLLIEILAAVLNRPIEVPAGEQVTSLGAAIVGAVAGGLFGSIGEAAAAMASPLRRVEPDGDLADDYDDLYETWLEAEQALAESEV